MGNEIKYINEDGIRDLGEITMYALTTCAFCKLAMNFLRENSIKFKLLYLDELEIEIKKNLKAEIEKKYNTRIRYPFLTIDENSYMTGFLKMEWEERFLKK